MATPVQIRTFREALLCISALLDWQDLNAMHVSRLSNISFCTKLQMVVSRPKPFAQLQVHALDGATSQCNLYRTGVPLDVFSFSALIKGFVQNSQLDPALEVLTEMKATNAVKPNEVLTLQCICSISYLACSHKVGCLSITSQFQFNEIRLSTS